MRSVTGWKQDRVWILHTGIPQPLLIGNEYVNKRILDEKYNSKSAALYRDKIATEAQGNVSIFIGYKL